MSKIETGGPAFPSPGVLVFDVIVDAQEGATLRDYFAAKAMQSLVINCAKSGLEKEVLLNHVSQTAYAAADAMLEARK